MAMFGWTDPKRRPRITSPRPIARSLASGTRTRSSRSMKPNHAMTLCHQLEANSAETPSRVGQRPPSHGLIVILGFGKWRVCLPSKKGVGLRFLQNLSGFFNDFAQLLCLIGVGLGRTINALVRHGRAPSAKQAGARLVSQPPTPTGRPSAGDAEQPACAGFVPFPATLTL